MKYCTTLIIAVSLEVLKSGSVLLLMLQYCVNFFLSLFFLRQDLVFPRLASNFLLAEEDLELLIPLPKPNSRVLGLRVCDYMPPLFVCVCLRERGRERETERESVCLSV